MRSLREAVLRFVRSEEGPTAVEYAVMLAFIILVCIAAILTLGERTAQAFNDTGSSIPT